MAIKVFLMTILRFIYFIFISVPLAITILIIAETLFILKNIIKWKKN